MKQTLFNLIVLLFWPLMMATAQNNVNIKFGKPTMEEMQMTTYEAEPDADAVVLCRLTNVEYVIQSVGYLADYYEKWRIKVLKPSGTRYAKVVVPYQVGMSVGNNITGLRASFIHIPMDRISGNSAFQDQDGPMSEAIFGTDGDENVENVKATAFNLEGKKVVKTPLKRGAVKTTKIDDHHYQVEFTVPDVKEGTVIEYEYKIHSQLFWELRDWHAQCEIPVVYAKLDMNIPNYLIFNVEDHGIQRLTYTCTQGTLQYKVESDPLATPMWVNTNHYVFEGRNLMGLPKDDHVWCVQDYWAGITSELKEYRLRGMNQMDYAKTWQQIDEMVLNSDDLGIHMNDHSPLSKELKEAKIEEIADLRERAVAVYKLVMGKVKWNGKYELSPALSSETVKAGEGTNADINLLLLQSLHDVGLNAAPVMLRTRDLGMLPYNFPTIRKFSTFIVGIILPTGGNVYLDASSRYESLNCLPEVMLVEKARLVRKDNKSHWVNLQKVSKTETNTVIDATLTADGTLSGKQTTRLSVGEYKSDPTETAYNKQGQVTDGVISICPFPDKLIERFTSPWGGREGVSLENAFAAETRMMPVEFSCIGSNRMVINISLPEGYAVDGEPKNTTVTTPDKGIEGRIQTAIYVDRVQLTCQFNITRLAHPKEDYADLRQIFDMLNQYTNEQLVIKKK